MVTDVVMKLGWTPMKIGSILNPLAGKFSKDTGKKGKGAKQGHLTIGRPFICRNNDWLKGSYMTRVAWLPNETDYSYCEFVAPNTPYCWRNTMYIAL